MNDMQKQFLSDIEVIRKDTIKQHSEISIDITRNFLKRKYSNKEDYIKRLKGYGARLGHNTKNASSNFRLKVIQKILNSFNRSIREKISYLFIKAIELRFFDKSSSLKNRSNYFEVVGKGKKWKSWELKEYMNNDFSHLFEKKFDEIDKDFLQNRYLELVNTISQTSSFLSKNIPSPKDYEEGINDGLDFEEITIKTQTKNKVIEIPFDDIYGLDIF